MSWHDGWNMGWMGFGLILMAVCILFIAWVSLRPRQDGGPGSPKEILKRRYAAGEIDQSEYATKLKELRE